MGSNPTPPATASPCEERSVVLLVILLIEFGLRKLRQAGGVPDQVPATGPEMLEGALADSSGATTLRGDDPIGDLTLRILRV